MRKSTYWLAGALALVLAILLVGCTESSVVEPDYGLVPGSTATVSAKFVSGDVDVNLVFEGAAEEAGNVAYAVDMVLDQNAVYLKMDVEHEVRINGLIYDVGSFKGDVLPDTEIEGLGMAVVSTAEHYRFTNVTSTVAGKVLETDACGAECCCPGNGNGLHFWIGMGTTNEWCQQTYPTCYQAPWCEGNCGYNP